MLAFRSVPHDCPLGRQIGSVRRARIRAREPLRPPPKGWRDSAKVADQTSAPNPLPTSDIPITSSSTAITAVLLMLSHAFASSSAGCALAPITR